MTAPDGAAVEPFFAPPDDAGDERLREVEAELADALPVLPLVCRQLTESVECVERAVTGVCGEFQSIADKAIAGVGGGAAGAGGEDHIAAASVTISRLLGRAEEAHNRLGDTARRVESVEADVQAIQAVARTMDSLTRALKVLSINARIEATRAGDAGRSFAVVAGETGKVAVDAARMNQSIHEMADRLGRGVRESAAEIRTRVAEGRRDVEVARAEVEGTLKLLAQTSEGLRGAVAAAAREAEELNRMIGRAVVALQFQDTVSQRVGHVVATLQELNAELARLVPDGVGEEPGGAWRERMSRWFTMAEEHRALEGGGGARTVGDIELF
ncbi:methyl-accepting chemotaxis protein [Frigoriglobus tundricola]|uniref:Methyl-accepting transducer domain-containing protein n=1 Tax=Frigoriglobus tundricola TaxID=2774151 RepID=A0A6M5YWC6_9BACT|nr:methyl-accepting chemotaxis protein [Frigoriglobus tundricola]QJW98238.1 hypothetical protein FTUN_5822 [Frigoriglobus tundricola]